MSTLSGAFDFSERQFQRGLLERERRERQAQIDQLIQQVNISDETTKRLSEEQASQLQTLGEIQEILTESTNDLAKTQRDILETQSKLAADARAVQEKAAADLKKAVEELTEAIRGVTAGPSSVNKSAGGTIGRETRRRRAVRPSQWGDTGDIKVVFASGSYPGGWAVCDGTELSVDSYPELYDHIRRTFGTPSSDGVFKLPTAAEIFTGGIEPEFVVLMRV